MSGRFLFVLAALAAGCGQPQAAEAPPTAPVEAPLVVEAGPASPARQAEAAELFEMAREAMTAGRPGEAADLAARVVEDFPTTAVSGRALRLRIDAALADQRWEEADEAAERYVSLLPEGDPRRDRMRLLQAEAMAGLPDEVARVERLLRIREGVTDELRGEATAVAREAVRALTTEEARQLVERTPPGRPLAPVLEAWLARLLVADGRVEEAEGYALAALDAGAAGPDSLLAATVLDPEAGTLPPIPGRRTVRIGSILPLTGSPALREVARLVAEGVEVAAASVDDEGLQVELLGRDDAGDPAVAAGLVAELEREEALGAVGFLRDRELDAAARARRGSLPLISPTAHASPDAGHGVFTMAGSDPLAARAVAEYGADQGYVRAAILHSRLPESAQEARAIEATLRARGVELVGSYAYDPGATFFESQIRGALEGLRYAEIRALNLTEEDTLHVEELDSVALFVPIPAEDVEYVAPQLTFFGVDTLGVDLYGTSGWADAQTLETVDDRHTTGVVATTPVSAGPGSPGYARFREAYEAYFQRTLVSPVPALGHDAALLLLEAISGEARSPRQAVAALSRIRDLEGATGIFSVVDGRILRRQEVVRIVNGATIPVLPF